jgi:putative FmdB family regulatory protein
MPIYEYRRPDGSTFEIQQPFSDDPLTHDPDTGVKVQRVLHAPAVHFKGSGFYNTDYGTRKRQRETQSDSDSSSKSSDTSGSSEKTTESATKSDGENSAKAAPAKETSSETKKAESPKKK